jgi:hypothetical protein
MPKMSIVSLAAIAAMTFASAGSAQDTALPQYRMDMTLYDGARIVGKPAMVVSAWTANQVEIANADGSRYRAAFTVEPRDGEQLLVMSQIEVASASGAVTRATPIAEVELGKPVFFFVGEDAGSTKQFRAEMTIRQTSN